MNYSSCPKRGQVKHKQNNGKIQDFSKMQGHDEVTIVLDGANASRSTNFQDWGENTQRVNHFCSKNVIYNKYYNISKLKF